MSEDTSTEHLTHIDARGAAHMVDVGDKQVAVRQSEARGSVAMRRETLELIRSNAAAKGDVLGLARVAGIMAAKRTAELIPLCHTLLLSSVEVEFSFDEEDSRLDIVARVKTAGKTGVEMEALTAVTVAALTIYDMCKAVDRGMVISDVRLTLKSGGKSGTWTRE